jgi:uncharacterized protein YdeI (YjbR/CyaY-like superfamily)
MPEFEMMLFPTQEDWENWLLENHSLSPGVWLKIAKKGCAMRSVSYDEALNGALCYGWIDSRKEKFDECFWLQRFTPRRSRSPWSAINRRKAEELIQKGKIRPAGLLEIEKARQDGRWEAAYQSQSNAEVPDDLRQALEENPTAREFFERLNRVNRYAILYRLNSAKKPETRQKRLTEFIQMLSEQRKIYE